MTGYHEMQAKQVRRIMRVLLRPGYRPMTQAALARAASSPTVPITAAHIRALTPLIEHAARAADRYYNRPVFGSYRISLSTQPYAAARSAIQRWRHIVGRALNDTDLGASLPALTTCGDREIERLSQRFTDGYHALIDAHRRVEADINALVDRLDVVLRDG